MSTASQLFNDQRQLDRGVSDAKSDSGIKVWLCVETLWTVAMFLLFVVMGPFAAIAVVPAILSLGRQQGEVPMPEAIESKV